MLRARSSASASRQLPPHSVRKNPVDGLSHLYRCPLRSSLVLFGGVGKSLVKSDAPAGELCSTGVHCVHLGRSPPSGAGYLRNWTSMRVPRAPAQARYAVEHIHTTVGNAWTRDINHPN